MVVRLGCLVAGVGLQPSPVSALIDCLLPTVPRGKLDFVELIATSSERCLDSAYLIKFDIENRLDTYVNVHVLSGEDVKSFEDVAEFLKISGRIIRYYVRRGVDVYVSVSGGRKDSVSSLIFLGSLFGAKRAFHVITEGISYLNELWFQVYQHLKSFHRLSQEEKQQKYNEYRELINEVLHPSKEAVSLVEVPLIPVTNSFRKNLHEILRGINFGELLTESEEMTSVLRKMGYVEFKEKTVFLTRLGKLLLDLLEG